MDADILMETEDLVKTFGFIRAVDGLNLQVKAGEMVGLVGPDGAGKTTVMRLLCGALQATNGRIRVAGFDIPKQVEKAREHIGYLAQHDDPADSAGATTTPVEMLRRATPMTEAAANNYLHQFFLGREQLSTPVSQLSYGERRRLALALLVRGGANLLLLDEPTNHLDLPSREAFETAFEGYEGASIAVTHDRRFIERFADVVIEL